jgi:hypothetical protein
MLGKIIVMIAQFTSASNTDSAGLFQWDVCMQRCEQFPGLPMPLEVLLTGQVPVGRAVTAQAQSSIELFQPRDAALVPNSSL